MYIILAAIVHLGAFLYFDSFTPSIMNSLLLMAVSVVAATAIQHAEHYGFLQKALWLTGVVIILIGWPSILATSITHMAALPEAIRHEWLLVTVLALPIGVVAGSFRFIMGGNASGRA